MFWKRGSGRSALEASGCCEASVKCQIEEVMLLTDRFPQASGKSIFASNRSE
jgi:hypothetical protein